jgi:hypothetical protein
MSDEDLAMWEEEPENFVKDQELDSSETIKCAAEMLFTALLENFQSRLAPFIVQYTSAVLKETFGSFDKNKLLLRESCYNALGWGSYYLYDLIPFDEWYKSLLCKELEVRDTRYRVIRRRVCWLLGKWVEKIESEEIHKSVYGNIIILLQENDIVLRLSALLTLKPRMLRFTRFNNHSIGR